MHFETHGSQKVARNDRSEHVLDAAKLFGGGISFGTADTSRRAQLAQHEILGPKKVKIVR